MHKPSKKNPYKSIGKDHTNLLNIRKAKMKVVKSEYGVNKNPIKALVFSLNFFCKKEQISWNIA
jgi:hypothetical protein